MVSLNFVFIFALVIVGINLLPVIFPSLLVHEFGNIYTDRYEKFEIGNNAILLILSGMVIFSIGFLYKKNKILGLSSIINKIRNFEFSKKHSLIIGVIILAIYAGITSPELSLDESEQYADYDIVLNGIETFPITDSGDRTYDEQNSRFVRMILLIFSYDYFDNVKIIPFIFSIILVTISGLVAAQISNRRIAGILTMIVLLQAHTFLEYDTIAVYENFWTCFFLLSIYTIQKRWYLSGIFYILSVFSKAFATPFLILNVYYVLRNDSKRSTKLKILASYGVVILFMLILFAIGNTIYDDIIHIDFNRFLIGFSHFSSQLQFDIFLLIMILPVSVGLFFTARNGIKNAESLLFFIPVLLLFGPLVGLVTDYFVTLPYRFVPLIVFFSISFSVVLFRNIKSS
tara:strand:+ start:172 stop:1374 length:1203 start_codon:yes stop_codon:yes gene_type:complete